MNESHHRAALRRLKVAGTVLVAVGMAAACSDDDGDGGKEPESKGSPNSQQSATDPGEPANPSPTGSTGKYDEIELADYTYTLRRACQCRDYGAVEVTVEGGEATSAVFQDDLLGVNPGEDAPEEYLLSINDIIAFANDPDLDSARVGRAPGAEWPRTVFLDPDEKRDNDEIFFRIEDVTPAG